MSKSQRNEDDVVMRGQIVPFDQQTSEQQQQQRKAEKNQNTNIMKDLRNGMCTK